MNFENFFHQKEVDSLFSADDNLYYILHMLNSTKNQGIANAIENEKFKSRMRAQQEYQRMKKEISDDIISRLSVDIDVQNAILNIKSLKHELDEIKKYFNR